MPTLPELFADLFAYVLLFEQTVEQGEEQPSYEQVRGEISALLKQQESAAKRQGLLEQEYQDARFAFVAWADETILKHTNWQHHNQWKAFPLQLEYYQTRNAGEEFFERLERLRGEQREIREIYYLCLGLGFSGRYFLGIEDELTLNQIRHEQAQHLPSPLEEIEEVDKLTPQPYSVPSVPGKPIRLPWTHLLLKVGTVLLVVIPLGLLLAYLFWPSPPEGTTLRQQVARWLEEHPEMLQCAEVRVDAVDPQTGTVTLAGRVASEKQGAEIRSGLEEIAGITQVTDQFQIVPHPFCAVVELLEPWRKQSMEQGWGLEARLNKGGTPPLYYRGENLEIDIKTPATFASYLYVDYYTADGGVGHLFPNTQEAQNFFEPNSRFTVGQRQRWEISPPFGLELVTVIASKTPLFSSVQFAEPAEAYLTRLRQVLQKASSHVAADFYFITTQDQK